MKLKKISLIGVLILVLAVFLAFVFYDNYQNVLVSDYFEKNSCSKNQKELMEKIMMYATEMDATMPGEEIWDVLEVEHDSLKCVNDKRSNVKNSYAYNANLFSLRLNNVTTPAVLIATADSEEENNLMRGFSDLTFRHFYKETGKSFAIISYIDGHVGIAAPRDVKFIKFENSTKE